MRTALALGWGFLKKQRRSSLLLLGTVALSAAFLVCMCLVGSSAIHTARENRMDIYGEYKAAVWGVETDMEEFSELFPVWNAVGRIGTCGSFLGVDGKVHLVGSADAVAAELLRLRLVEGELPSAPGEAVFEKSVARQLGMDGLTLGESVALRLESGEELRVRVCGIAENFSAVKNNAIDPGSNSPILPSVLISGEGMEVLETVYVLGSELEDFWSLSPCLPPAEGKYVNTDAYPGGYALEGVYVSEEVGLTLAVLALVGGVVAVCTATVVLNGFLMSVDRRRKQISLLRCVGATRKQAMSVVTAEGLILLALGLPLGIALGLGVSFFAVELFGALSGLDAVWSFSWWPIPLAAAICGVCVLLSTVIPALRAGKQPPIDNSGVNAKLRRRLFFRRRAVGTAGLTGINLLSSLGRTVITGLTFSLVIIVCGCSVLLCELVGDSGYAVPDVEISPESSGISYEGEEAKMKNAPFFVSYRAMTKYLSLPTGLPARLEAELDMACTWSYVEPRFAVAIDRERFDGYLNGYFVYEREGLDLPEAQAEEGVVGMPIGEYPYLSAQLSYGIDEDEYLIKPYVFSVSEALLERLKANVTTGRIDVDAIARGEEIVLTLPNYEADYSSYPFGTSFRVLGREEDSPYIDGQVFKNQNWKAGDELVLTWVDVDLQGVPRLVRHPVTVGATVTEGLSAYGMPGQIFGVYVGTGTLQSMGAPHSVRESKLYFPKDVEVEAGEEEVLSWMEEYYPSLRTKTLTDVNRAEQQQKRLITGIVAMVVTCLSSLGVLGLVNTASVRIHSRRHSLGLLRCIGMTKGQIILMLTSESAAIGLGASGVGLLVCRLLLPVMEENWRYPALGPALGFACLGTLALAVATVFVPAIRIMRSVPTEITRRGQ